MLLKQVVPTVSIFYFPLGVFKAKYDPENILFGREFARESQKLRCSCVPWVRNGGRWSGSQRAVL